MFDSISNTVCIKCIKMMHFISLFFTELRSSHGTKQRWLHSFWKPSWCLRCGSASGVWSRCSSGRWHSRRYSHRTAVPSAQRFRESHVRTGRLWIPSAAVYDWFIQQRSVRTTAAIRSVLGRLLWKYNRLQITCYPV